MTPASDSFSFLGVFLIGLALNLTPCVYPMMTVTVSLFGAQKDAGRFNSFLKAVFYVLGIAATYSTLGTIAAVTGGFFGAIMQNKFVLAGIAVILAALAMSMFGLYVFQLPSGLVQKVSGRRSTTLIGFFISGLLVGVFAAPCVGPTIVALLVYVGQKGSALYAFLMFFLMSLGLGLPYLILGTFSGLLQKLPRSGVWLIWIERLFGVVLMALAFFYLALALKPEFVKFVVPASLIAGGLYLAFERSAQYKPGFKRFKIAAGFLAALAGGVLFMSGPKQQVVWTPYSQPVFDAALASGKPIIFDFFADWCIPCHELDNITYSDPKVIEALSGFERIKVDLTEADDPASESLIEKYDIIGVPTVLFAKPGGEEAPESRLTGFIPPDEFLEHLKKAGL